MKNNAVRHFQWYIRQVKSFLPGRVKRCFPQELSGELLAEVDDLEAAIGREFERADMKALLRTKPTPLRQAAGFWPAIPGIKPEILPAAVRSWQLCGVYYFLPAFIWVNLVALLWDAYTGKLSASNFQAALIQVLVTTLSAFGALLAVSVMYHSLKRLFRSEAMP